jgi:hypothetical protein
MKFFCILCLHHLPQEEFADLDEFICRTCFPQQREALLSPPSENQRSTLTPDRLLLPPGNEGYPLLLPPGKSEA